MTYAPNNKNRIANLLAENDQLKAEKEKKWEKMGKNGKNSSIW